MNAAVLMPYENYMPHVAIKTSSAHGAGRGAAEPGGFPSWNTRWRDQLTLRLLLSIATWHGIRIGTERARAWKRFPDGPYEEKRV